MYDVVKVSFDNTNRVYWFAINNIFVNLGDKIVVDSERGIQIGTVASDIQRVSEEKLIFPLKNVLRKATSEDLKTYEKSKSDAEKALNDAKKIAKDLNLNMNILNASFTFDKNQLLFNFISDDRIDFRELVKKLASIYKTRIELRQIGVRDKAKEIGGLGPCGRFLCCNSFLNDFESVSINMAKNQYISLKPNKINGICGRLLCCLNYEDDQYTELKKTFPSIGSIIKYKDFSGKVVSYNLFKKIFFIETKDKNLLSIGLEEYESNK